MTKVFVSGSIKLKKLDKSVLERLDNIVHSNFIVIVGDADGIDRSVQEYLKERDFSSVMVYCSGSNPRNNKGGWIVKNVSSPSKPGTRDFYTAKDRIMADDCDYGLMVWDAKSTGTLSNAIELVRRKKIALVYISQSRQFVKVKDVCDVETLLRYMSDAALKSADQKINIQEKVQSMKFPQKDLLPAQQAAPVDAPAPNQLNEGYR